MTWFHVFSLLPTLRSGTLEAATQVLCHVGFSRDVSCLTDRFVSSVSLRLLMVGVGL